MGYACREDLRPDAGGLLPEEIQVRAALAEYTFDRRSAKPTDFTPTAVLYATYLEYAQRFKSPDAPSVMNAKQFGVALNRAFGLDRDRWTKRTYQGRKVHGYHHVLGPGSVTTQPPRRHRPAA